MATKPTTWEQLQEKNTTTGILQAKATSWEKLQQKEPPSVKANKKPNEIELATAQLAEENKRISAEMEAEQKNAGLAEAERVNDKMRLKSLEQNLAKTEARVQQSLAQIVIEMERNKILAEQQAKGAMASASSFRVEGSEMILSNGRRVSWDYPKESVGWQTTGENKVTIFGGYIRDNDTYFVVPQTEITLSADNEFIYAKQNKLSSAVTVVSKNSMPHDNDTFFEFPIMSFTKTEVAPSSGNYAWILSKIYNTGDFYRDPWVPDTDIPLEDSSKRFYSLQHRGTNDSHYWDGEVFKFHDLTWKHSANSYTNFGDSAGKYLVMTRYRFEKNGEDAAEVRYVSLDSFKAYDALHADSATRCGTADSVSAGWINGWADTMVHPHENHDFNSDDHTDSGAARYITHNGIGSRNNMSGVIADFAGDTCFRPNTRRLTRADGDTALDWRSGVKITATDTSYFKSDASGKNLDIGTAAKPWNLATVNAFGLVVNLTEGGQLQVNGSSGVELIYLGTSLKPVEDIYYNGVVGVDIANWLTKGGVTGTGIVEKSVGDLAPGDKVLCIPA